MDAGIDWNAVWRARLAAHRSSPGFVSGGALWKDHQAARRYDAGVGESDRVDQSLAALPLGPGDSVLDIGAGPGTLAVPIARLVRRVDAVEPAAGMAAVLRERAAKAGLGNIRVVEGRWEDLDPAHDLDPPYDVVVSSFSLAMPDLAAALEKMEEVAAGSVHIFWHAGTPAWERQYRALWPALHGAPYRPVPKAGVVFNLLRAMGRRPKITMHAFIEERRFSSLEDALSYYAPRFSANDKGQRQILAGALERWLEFGEGGPVMRGRSRFAHIWWEKEER
jgi:SAM-dependent methyltransferase